MFGHSCDEMVFNGITPERFTQLQQQAAADAIAITGDSGTATANDITMTWDYDRAAQTLTVQCTDKPMLIPCSLISSRLEALIGGYTS